MMFLLDTNVFLEVLLGQEKRGRCRDFLNGNTGDLNVTDFTLHSIGGVGVRSLFTIYSALSLRTSELLIWLATRHWRRCNRPATQL